MLQFIVHFVSLIVVLNQNAQSFIEKLSHQNPTDVRIVAEKIPIASGFNWIIVILWIQNHRNLRWLFLDLIIQQFACFKHSIPTISKERANFLKCFAATNRRKRHSNINQFRLSNYIDSIIIRNFHSHTDDWFIKMNSRCYDELCYHMPYAICAIWNSDTKVKMEFSSNYRQFSFTCIIFHMISRFWNVCWSWLSAISSSFP